MGLEGVAWRCNLMVPIKSPLSDRAYPTSPNSSLPPHHPSWLILTSPDPTPLLADTDPPASQPMKKLSSGSEGSWGFILNDHLRFHYFHKFRTYTRTNFALVDDGLHFPNIEHFGSVSDLMKSLSPIFDIHKPPFCLSSPQQITRINPQKYKLNCNCLY